jgi:hypothetical protein
MLALLQEAKSSPRITEGGDWWARVLSAIEKAGGTC